MDQLNIEFADGNRLECCGFLIRETSEGELLANGDGTYTEVTDSVQFFINEGTLWGKDAEVLELQRGLFLINQDGLWQHITDDR